MHIEQVIAKHTEALMQLPNVIGVGLGEKRGHAVIKVLVTRKLPPAADPRDRHADRRTLARSGVSPADSNRCSDQTAVAATTPSPRPP